MNKPPLVSVLITCYNREAYLAEAIESVLAGSFGDFEVLITDDYSSDRSFEIAQQFENRDERIKAYRNEKNLGQFENRNHAASLAAGKYIKFLDSDDKIQSQGLQVMVEAMEKFQGSAFGMEDPSPRNEQAYPFLGDQRTAFREHLLKRSYFIMGPTAVIFNREIFLREGGFKTGFTGADNEILTRLALHYPFVIFQSSLTWWRQHEQQEIKTGIRNNSYLINDFKQSRKLIQHPDLPFTATERNKALRKLINLYSGKIVSFLFKFKFGKIWIVLSRTSYLRGLISYFIPLP